jgi:predicted nucleic acid-binding protein
VKTFVVDASVGAKWTSPGTIEPLADRADRFLRAYVNGSFRILVPDLFWIEIANFLWKSAKRGEITAVLAGHGLETILNRDFPTVPSHSARSIEDCRRFWQNSLRQHLRRAGGRSPDRTHYRGRTPSQRTRQPLPRSLAGSFLKKIPVETRLAACPLCPGPVGTPRTHFNPSAFSTASSAIAFPSFFATTPNDPE